MIWRAIHAALKARDAAQLALALLPPAPGHAAHQMHVALEEFTVGELRRVHDWAEDWLSEPANAALRRTSDARWGAMHALYNQAGALLRQIDTDTPHNARSAP